MTMKHNTAKPIGHDESIFKRKVYSCKYTHKKNRVIPNNDASQGP